MRRNALCTVFGVIPTKRLNEALRVGDRNDDRSLRQA